LTGPASALITIRNYASANPPNGTVPTHSEAHGLVNIRLNASATGIVCQLGSLFGPLGHVSCDLVAGSGPGDRSARIVVSNTALFDRVMILRLVDADHNHLLDFLRDAGFPKA
jgi:hypothetical protein